MTEKPFFFYIFIYILSNICSTIWKKRNEYYKSWKTTKMCCHEHRLEATLPYMIPDDRRQADSSLPFTFIDFLFELMVTLFCNLSSSTNIA
ncbi:hypothetical protein RCL_jg18790.t1 [Rhizophagus clarus]|uniref:Uncharacterized protein n=1 Tax=Rhizophagus clarus TaxID=94130 RepID=A0A8H3R5U3_9GLOM|nr:hypothetical protein RCL_jg18790.t1 [Rhizophagus clarus]